MSTKTKIKSNLRSKYFDKKVSEESNEVTINVSKKKRKTEDKSKESKEPKNWRKLYENISSMRSSEKAVVDEMGAEKTFDANPELNPKTKRFQILVSLMLSSQTRDEITYKTMQSLREYGLNLDHILETSEEQLKELIRSVSFFNTKAKHIKKTAIILRDEFDGDIPDTVEGLLSLAGVGPKMAHLAMQIAWNQCTGIAVDTHVHRISNRLEWVDSKTPIQTQKQLEEWVPKNLWNNINLLLVGFGQTICTPLRPKCGQCLNQKLCPFAKQLDF